MGHGVDHVVHADADGQRGKLFRIVGCVGPLPGVAEVGVVGNGYHDAALVVVNAAPMGAARASSVVALVTRTQVRLAGHLVAVGEIVDGMKDGVGVVDVDDGT